MVGFVSQPVHTGRPTSACFRIDMLDQQAPDAAAPRMISNEEVLKIAIVAGLRCSVQRGHVWFMLQLVD